MRVGTLFSDHTWFKRGGSCRLKLRSYYFDVNSFFCSKVVQETLNIKSATNHYWTDTRYVLEMKPTLYIHSCILFYLTDPTRKSLNEGVLPSVNLPAKSFQKAPKMRLTKSGPTLTTPILLQILQRILWTNCQVEIVRWNTF